MGNIIKGGLSEIQKWRKSYWIWDDIAKAYIDDLVFSPDKDVITVKYLKEDKVTPDKSIKYNSSLSLFEYVNNNPCKFSY